MAESHHVQGASCPHCSKPFQADVISPDTALAGIKCPHCKLFVPLDRVVEPDAA